MISIHIIRYNNILKILSIISFIILIIFLNGNVYDDLKKKSDQYNLISISCKNNTIANRNASKICQNIFTDIFQIFYNINISDQKVIEYSEIKITTYEEFEKGFIKSGKGYFNFYIYKSESDKFKFDKFIKLIDKYKKDITISIFNKNEEIDSKNGELQMTFDDSIFINFNFE